MSKPCPECGDEIRTEPLTRSDGSQIGSITIDVCDRCDEEMEINLERFLDRVRRGDFDD